MQKELIWELPPNCLHCIYTPEPHNNTDHCLHPILGYPVCPLVGRYSKGEYKIPDVMLFVEFKCRWAVGTYRCGDRDINLPPRVVEVLKTIPEVIPHNKPKSQQKNTKIPDTHPVHFKVRDQLSFSWLISFGTIGKDFLNYLNHTYIFDQSVFFDDKLNRTIHNLPIMAYLPENSGIENQEVQKGLCLTHLRSEYLSIHLKGGAPAFSPNNMRLGIEGYAKNLPEEKQKKDKKKKKKQKGNYGQQIHETENKQAPQDVVWQEDVEDYNLNWNQMYEDIKNEKFEIKQEKVIKKEEKEVPPKKGGKDHQKFVHFYTVALLEEQYKVFYHWHIDESTRRDILPQLLKSSKCLEEFLTQYVSIIGLDSMGKQINQILRVF